MNEGRTVFAQLMDELPKYQFDKCVRRYSGNHRVRSLPTYEQFLVMAFAQLTYRESLRDSTTCLGAAGPKLYHSGITGLSFLVMWQWLWLGLIQGGFHGLSGSLICSCLISRDAAQGAKISVGNCQIF